MYTFQDISIGMTTEREYTFLDDAVKQFGDLVKDYAPVHTDERFAVSKDFLGRIVHGMFLASIFSGMLGQELPGFHSVINTLSIKVHNPVYIGDTVRYRVRVAQLSVAVKAIVLELYAERTDGVVVLTGTATCSFPGFMKTV